MPFQAGFIYPLADAEAYDDDFGTGYAFAAIDHDATPGTCYIHDAWIVNADGQVHPGYDSCPVPLRLEDIVEADGRPNPASLPQPKSILDSAWAR